MKVNKGFTLIEVLISAIILFSSIALIAEIFSTASFSSRKAVEKAKLSQVISLANKQIVIEIQTQAKDQELQTIEGSLTFQHHEFIWVAKRVSFLPPPRDTFQNIDWNERFGLFVVSVEVNQNDHNQNYEFKVATW